MSAMSKFVILLGGSVTPTQRLKEQIDGARIIAADGGIAHSVALALEPEPELWVGDFDSSNADLQKAFAHVPRQAFPAEKDATDGELAIAEALRRGATQLILVGGFGGQLDHTLAHAGFLVALERRGMSAFMTSGHEEAYPLVEELYIDDVALGTRLSIVPMTDLKALTISGVKWPLTKRDVPLGAALTLSNVVEGPVNIDLRFGAALVLIYPTTLE
jgi:thiamine pyrophosphokinase